MFQRVIILTGFILFCSHMQAQTSDDYIRMGNTAFQYGDYFGASGYYEQAIGLGENSPGIYFRCGDAYRLSYNYGAALEKYIEIELWKPMDTLVRWEFWAALMNKNLGQYDIAKDRFEKFLQQYTYRDDYYSKKTVQEILSCEYAMKMLKDTVPVKIEHPGIGINTPYSEFAAASYKGNKLYFSSIRNDMSGETDAFIPQVYTAKIYVSRLTMTGWRRVGLADKPINNPKYHNANASFTSDLKTIFFSRCKGDNPVMMQSFICKSELKDGKWQNPEELPESINLQGYTATQPYFAEGYDYSVLYFVSDRPGGYGKLDIWYAVFKDGKFYEPVNLGQTINTPDDEISPFYDTDNGLLYFSSEWHQGFGGLDIFSSKGGLNLWENPKNLGIPYNSSCNDLFFSINNRYLTGFFTSNRPGSLHIKGETCCYDIYYFEQLAEIPKDTIVPVQADTLTITMQARKLLPLTLYFHNDEPEPRTNKTTTTKNYKTTLDEYFALKEKYEKEYAKGLNDEEKAQAIVEINEFFDNVIARGLEYLEAFTLLLIQDLEAGNKVTIKVKGYTSPLNTAEYNKNLAKRRIVSLINYFREYENGALLRFMNPENPDAAMFRIVEEPIGEMQANPLVSDNPNDQRNSIYSRAAARERRIQILYYDSEKGVELEQPPVKDVSFELGQYVFNLGQMEKNQKLVISIPYKNSGATPIKIVQIATQSKCISFNYPQKEIAPGEDGTLYMHFDNSTLSGQFSEETILYLEPELQLKLVVNGEVAE